MKLTLGWAPQFRISRQPLAAIIVTAMLALLAAIPAIASQGGNNNKGDVWLDNVATVGQDSNPCSAPTDITTQAENCESPGDGGPGHSHDPHLDCRNIDLWGDKLADPSGEFTIDGWPPSGKMQQAWPGTALSPGTAAWDYEGVSDADSSGKGTATNDVIATIDVQQLIANAIANGDTPHPIQGFHFKLQFSQDPQKHKTFWVNCDSPSPTPSPGVTPAPTPTPTPILTPTPTPTPIPTPTPTPGVTPSPTPTSGASPIVTPGATPSATPGLGAGAASGVLAATTTVGLPNTGTAPPIGALALQAVVGILALAAALSAAGLLLKRQRGRD